MTGADDDRPTRLRIGGWLSPSQPEQNPSATGISETAGPIAETAGRSASAADPSAEPAGSNPEAAGPSASEADPVTSPARASHVSTSRAGGQEVPLVRRPVPQPYASAWIPPGSPPPLGEHPAHRMGAAQGNPLRSRAVLFIALAAAAAVPLVADMTTSPNLPLQARPETSLTPRVPQWPPVELPHTPGTSPSGDGPITPSYQSPVVPAWAEGLSPSIVPAWPGQPTTGPDRSPTPHRRQPSTGPALASPPPAVRVAISVEAESPGAHWEGPVRPRVVAGASGGLVVGGDASGLSALLGTSAIVEFGDIVVEQTKTYTITLYYVATKARDTSVWVNGRRSSLSFAPTSGDNVGRLSFTAPLIAGPNTLRFGNLLSPLIPELDRITVTG